RDCGLRFTPPAGRQQDFGGSPFQGIDSHDIHIAMEPSMLKSIVEQKDVSELFLLRESAGVISIGPDHDRHISEALFHKKRLIAPLLPPTTVRPNHPDALADAAVTAGQDDRQKPAIAQCLSKGNDKGGLAGTAKSEISDADHRMA